MKAEVMAAMKAADKLLRDGSAHSLTSIKGAVRSSSRSSVSNLLDKMEALGVIETFTIIHSQPSIGGVNKRIKLRVARGMSKTLAEAIGQQALTLEGNICFPKEQELLLALLKGHVKTRYPRTKAIGDSAWSATKLGWHKTLSRMERLDGVAWQEQLEVLTWVTSSKHRDAGFWAGQVRSAESWRRHYAKIHGKFVAAQGKTTKSIDDDWEGYDGN